MGSRLLSVLEIPYYVARCGLAGGNSRNYSCVFRNLDTAPNYVQIGSHEQQVKAIDFARRFVPDIEQVQWRTRRESNLACHPTVAKEI
jgi:hypothetical protein